MVQIKTIKTYRIVSIYLTTKHILMNKFGFSFSLSRLLGIAQAKQRKLRTTGIPTTKSGMQRKIGASILKFFFK